jgi:hypothetical protein
MFDYKQKITMFQVFHCNRECKFHIETTSDMLYDPKLIDLTLKMKSSSLDLKNYGFAFDKNIKEEIENSYWHNLLTEESFIVKGASKSWGAGLSEEQFKLEAKGEWLK